MSFHWKVCMAPRWRRVSEALSSGLAYAALYVFCLAKLILHLSRLVIGWSCQAEFTRRNASNGGGLGCNCQCLCIFWGPAWHRFSLLKEPVEMEDTHTHTQTKGNYRQGQASILTDNELMQNISCACACECNSVYVCHCLFWHIRKGISWAAHGPL